VEILTDFEPCPPEIVVEKTEDTLVGLVAGELTFIVGAGMLD